MQSVELDQNTKKWLEGRKKVIGGSDAASIMMVSPWRSPLQLYEEKKGICTPDHAGKAFIFWRGHHYEAIARQAYELKIGYDVPALVVKHSQIPWCQVSLDGCNLDKKKVIEIKYQGEADWYQLKEEGIVPDHYYPQLQYQLLATGFKSITFIGINKAKRLATTDVFPDLDYIKKMITWCSHFWDLVKKGEPPKHCQLDFKTLTRINAKKQCNRIYKIDAQLKKLFDERAALQDEVLKAARSTRMLFEGKVLIRTCDFDHGDLELIKELKGLDLDHLGRSVKKDLKLIIIKNTLGIKGAKSGKKSKGKTKSKKRKSSPKSSPKSGPKPGSRSDSSGGTE